MSSFCLTNSPNTQNIYFTAICDKEIYQMWFLWILVSEKATDRFIGYVSLDKSETKFLLKHLTS